jgi:hypothetical protein
VQFLDFAIEGVEGGAERAWERVVLREERWPVRPNYAQVECGIEEGDLQAVAGRGISVRLWNAVDQTFESKAAEVVGHLRGGIRTPPERFDLRAEIAIAKNARQMGKRADGLEERHDAGIAKAQCRDPLPGGHGRLPQAVEGVLSEHTVMTDVLDFEELAIDLLAEVAGMREIVEPFSDTEVPRVIDRDLGS